MSNESLTEHALIALRSYQVGEINLESLISSVELNVGALEGLVESQRGHLQHLATSLELAQFEPEGEDRIRKVDSLVEQLKDSFQSMGNASRT